MEKIASFTVNHLDLLPGIYVSRKDHVGDQVVTTFDIRVTAPNKEPVMETSEIHTLEHLGATYLRNHPDYKDKTIYFGPMGCRTGFYLVLVGDYVSVEVLKLITSMFDFCANFEGEIPGATARDCGNYKDQNLDLAKARAKKYLEVLNNITSERLVYPE